MNGISSRSWDAWRERVVHALGGRGPARRRLRWIGGLVVLVVALMPRVVFLVQLDEGAPTFDSPEGGDSRFYDRVAADGPAPQRAYFHSPLYRWFLSGIYDVFGRDLLMARAIQLLLGALTAWLIYWLTLRLFRRVSTATLAGVAAGLFGPALLYEGQLLVDGLIALLAVAVLHVLLDAVRRPSAPSFALVGALLGIGALARPVILVWLPVLLWFVATTRGPRRERGQHLAALVAGLVFAVAPVTLRNYLVEGDFVPVTANGGLNLYIGNNPNANGGYALPEGLWFRPGDPLDDFAGFKTATQAMGYEPSSAELSRWWAAKAGSFVASHPTRALELVGHKLRILVGDYEYPQMYNYYVYAEVAPTLSALPTAVFVVPLGIVGLVAMWVGRHGRSRRLVAILTASYGLGFVPFFVTGRYRVAWITLLTPFAAWVVVRVACALRHRRWRRAAVLTAATTAGVALSLWPLKAHPTRANQHIEFARARLVTGDAVGAVHWGQRATQVEPRHARAWEMYGRALRLAGQPAEAAAVLLPQATRHPEAAALHRELGAALLELGRPKDAAVALEQCLNLAPANTEAWLLLGDAMQQLTCWQRALDAYHTIAVLAPHSGHAQEANARRQALEQRLAPSPPTTDPSTCPW